MSKKTKKFQNLVIKTSSQPIHFITSKENGRDCFFFLMCNKEKLQLLRNWCNNNLKVDLRKYGAIVKSGFGKPTAKVILALKEEFGVDFSYLLE